MATTATDTRNDELTDLLSYISQLGLDDIDDLLSRNATGSGDALNDEELALLVFAEEAQGLLNIVKDHVSAAPSGVVDDVTTLLDQLVVMEDMARYDREMAIALSEGRDPPPRPVRATINASAVSHAEATPPPEYASPTSADR
ncbi:uncharacterized protein LAESUDRAFT_714427 [Laetiporus sulphureus 93-53]|uniref:Uncharacterized protein n=1 Tax=Laetiporus sulphureus 93-53 TaxID=1314785 RepID=A0A165E7A3_9APHY|nr:uncharacterized protein LAESUDRAFT_714427 [Laetiporus sulphureus 93-53]KZT06378.1 hypothetical protein LAESUDRAFT_714427 [Laetiporus sulphureus 93-53]